MTTLYSPLAEKGLWAGRTDTFNDEYVYQIIQYLDLNNLPDADLSGYGLLGFECDIGVTRNQGNPGAKEGPQFFRQALARCPLHSSFNLYDAGNVTCEKDDLESAQTELGRQVTRLLSHHLRPIIIGGGHETAWGHFQGLAHHYPHADIAILNFDAHFDLRPLINNQLGSSGTPFRQMQTYLTAEKKRFNYYCAGIQPFSNTRRLFDYAKSNQVHYILAETINANPQDLSFINQIIQSHEHIYVSVCMDVFSSAIAPGVSAPQPLGIGADYVIDALKLLKKSGKVISLDIVELAPKYDIQAQTVKLAAALLMSYLL